LNRTSPPSGTSCPASMLKHVVFPAPFGPINARISPRGRLRFTPSTATTPPNRFVRPTVSSTGGPLMWSTRWGRSGEARRSLPPSPVEAVGGSAGGAAPAPPRPLAAGGGSGGGAALAPPSPVEAVGSGGGAALAPPQPKGTKSSTLASPRGKARTKAIRITPSTACQYSV